MPFETTLPLVNEKRVCFYCCKVKNAYEFRPVGRKCIQCHRAQNRENYRKRFEKDSERKRNYYQDNKEEIRRKGNAYYALNRSRLIARQQVRRRERYKSDPEYRIHCALRNRLRRAASGNKKYSVSKLIGCSFSELRKHLESLFKPGMSWENHGEWHIDHKLPCAFFNLQSKDQQKRCFHYTNLQPLWAKDNIKKGGRL